MVKSLCQEIRMLLKRNKNEKTVCINQLTFGRKKYVKKKTRKIKACNLTSRFLKSKGTYINNAIKIKFHF